MTSCGDLSILFRASAGPRRGYGHLVRCRSLARALGVRPLIALRGGPRVVETAVALGCDVIKGSASNLLRCLSPDVLVVDDPVAADARRWMRAARRVGCLVVSIHDLGLGCLDADLVIDGSITRNARARRGQTLAGPQYAVLDPAPFDERGDRHVGAAFRLRGTLRRTAVALAEAVRRPRTISSAIRPRSSLRSVGVREPSWRTISLKRSSKRIRRCGFESRVALRGYRGRKRRRFRGSVRQEAFTRRWRVQAWPSSAAACRCTRRARTASRRSACQ